MRLFIVVVVVFVMMSGVVKFVIGRFVGICGVVKVDLFVGVCSIILWR